MHRERINVVKFSNHSPSIFATSSQNVKLWDLRQKPLRPCHTTSSLMGNVRVCFSPDDHYLLASADDNEGSGVGHSMNVETLRVDPHRDFNMSILACYPHPSSESKIVKINLLAHGTTPKNSIGLNK